HVDVPLDVIVLEDALHRASFMVEVLRDGRVLIDRDGRWSKLLARTGDFEAQARGERGVRAERTRQAIEMFAARAQATH
ncbi:MAG TPA: hypothetical protein VK781_06910, partial [Solirubrobacteraceae bacterium]|nr:hypothetical protein [Solirubrobacteraceae bacterium]